MTYPTTVAPAEPPPEHPVQRGVLLLTRALTYLVYGFLVIVEIILVIGFTLKLFGANPNAGFVEWAYRNLDSAMRPFRGIFAPIELGVNGNDVQATLETSIIFAMVMYGIVAIAVSALIAWLTQRLQQLDQKSVREQARRQHERELQALRDQAMILSARRPPENPGWHPTGSAPESTPGSTSSRQPGGGSDSATLSPTHGQAPPPPPGER